MHSAVPDGVLLADIGGTNVRIAVLNNGSVGPIVHMAVAEHRLFTDALEAFFAKAGGARMKYALFGVAGVVEGTRCALTNNAWVIDADELRDRFGFSDVHILNDFEAVAWSLPQFSASDLLQIGGIEQKSGAPMVVLGPGTGFGVAAYLPNPQMEYVVCSEGGHGTLPCSSTREDAVIERIRRRFGHVSIERLLAGSGLENLYITIAELDSAAVPQRKSTEITRAAIAGECAVSRSTLDMFCGLLGEVAGNFALCFGARAGVFIAGGIVSHIREYLLRSQFRARFEAKGRMTTYLKQIPVYIILHDDPAFLGLQSLATRRTWKL